MEIIIKCVIVDSLKTLAYVGGIFLPITVTLTCLYYLLSK